MLAKLHSMSPERVREYTRDGDFASYYERPDEEMLALWRSGVEETRHIIANDRGMNVTGGMTNRQTSWTPLHR
jgi:hypothetical protein